LKGGVCGREEAILTFKPKWHSCYRQRTVLIELTYSIVESGAEMQPDFM